MAETDFLGKGWKFPITMQAGKLGYSEAEQSIRESILIILGTSKGERVMRPTFGCNINEYVFAPNNTATASLLSFYVKEALLEWEPRIDVDNVAVAADEEEPNRLNIAIDYTIKSSNTSDNLVYPFYLEKAGK
jgi:phage baseplate assembly protein W